MFFSACLNYNVYIDMEGMDCMTTAKYKMSFKDVLFQRELILVFISAFFILLNLYTMLNLMPLYVIKTGESEFLAGIQNAAFSFSAVILRFYLGPLADTKGRKLPLIIGSFVFSTAPLLIWIAPNYWFQLLGRIYQAIGLATFLSSASSAVADYTPINYRGRIFGVYRGILSLSLMIGPSLGMKIVNKYNYSYFFIFSSIIGLISFFLVLGLPNKTNNNNENLIQTKVLSNILYLIKKPQLIKAYLGIVVICLSSGILFTYLSIYALDFGNIKNPGLYFTIYAGIGVFATIYSGYLSDRIGRERVIWPAMIALGIGIVALSILSSGFIYMFYISAILSGVGFSASLSVMITSVIDNAEDSMRATALVIQENAIDVAMASGAFLFGLGTIKFEMSTLYLLLGVFTVVFAIILSRIKSKDAR